MCWIPNPSTSPNSCAEFLILYLFWWQGIYRSNQVKVRSLVWTPIKCDWCRYEKGNLDIGMCIEKRWCEDTGRRETWNRSFSPSTEGTSSASPLISDIQLPELWEYPQFVIHILLWSLPRLIQHPWILRLSFTSLLSYGLWLQSFWCINVLLGIWCQD